MKTSSLWFGPQRSLLNQNRLIHNHVVVLEYLALGAILYLAAYLRLTNVEGNPGWYSDEGTLIDIAQNLLQGQVKYLTITQSTLLVARLPLFTLLLAGAFHLFGVSMMTLRMLTGLLGVATTGLLYLFVRRSRGGAGMSLLSAAILAVYPQAVLYSRIGFSYNLEAILVLFIILGLWEYLNTSGPKWLALAALAVGLGTISDLSMLSLLLPLVLVVSYRRWRDVLWSLPIAMLPFGIYVTWMLATAPEAFHFDLAFTFSRLGTFPLLAQLPVIMINYTLLIGRDPWLVVGIAGMFTLRQRRLQRLALILFWLPFVAIARTIAFGSNLGFYYLIPLLPLVAIGLSGLVISGARIVVDTVRASIIDLLNAWGWRPIRPQHSWFAVRLQVIGSALVLFVVVLAPFLMTAYLILREVKGEWETPIDGVMVNAQDAMQVAGFINSHVYPDDLVMASPAVAWMFNANVVDFQIAVAAEGQATPHLPEDIPSERFAFNPNYRLSRYVVVDPIWRNWAAPNILGVAEILADVEQWPLVQKVGEISVYANPAH